MKNFVIIFYRVSIVTIFANSIGCLSWITSLPSKQICDTTNNLSNHVHSSESETYLSFSRRDVVKQGRILASIFPFIRKASAIEQDNLPVAELPMTRLRLPKGSFGRDYIVIPLKIKGMGPFDFMLDSGLTTEIITPHLKNVLQIKLSGQTIKGLAAGGATYGKLIELQGASLCSGKFPRSKSNEIKLPDLNAVVADFPMEHIDPAHDPVEGMLGMEFLDLFDTEFDYPNRKIRFWEPGTLDKRGLIKIPASVINESGLIGMRVLAEGQKVQQPVIGIIDCGSAFSIINWEAAKIMGLPSRNDKSYDSSGSILGVGLDGNPQQMPLKEVCISFCGDAKKDPSSGELSFDTPPPNWIPWKTKAAIGDIPVFSRLVYIK